MDPESGVAHAERAYDMMRPASRMSIRDVNGRRDRTAMAQG